MRTNAVFSGFSASLVSATIFMNPITLVMNYLYFLFWHHRRHCWNRTPSLSLFLSNGSNHGWTLGGERSILLSYRDIYSIFGLFPGFLELQHVLRRLRRAVLLIKKRAIFDRFISSIRIIDPSAIVRREVGTVASGVISQEDLNSEQICPFSADSCSPFFLGGECSIPWATRTSMKNLLINR